MEMWSKPVFRFYDRLNGGYAKKVSKEVVDIDEIKLENL
jgi:hypothetical protein